MTRSSANDDRVSGERADHERAADAHASAEGAADEEDPTADPRRTASVRFRVRFDEAGPDGSVRASTLLRYAAEVAWVHSEMRGFDRAWYAERGLAWLVRGVEIEVLRRVDNGETLTGTTRVVAVRKVLARRRNEFRTEAGELAAVVTADWALTTRAGGPTRIPELFSVEFGEVATAFDPIRVRSLPPPPAVAYDFRVRPHELDPMDHANNAVYADWFEEAILAADASAQSPTGTPARTTSLLGALPRRYRMEYLGAAGPGRLIRASCWPGEAGWLARFIDVETGEPVLGALLEP